MSDLRRLMLVSGDPALEAQIQQYLEGVVSLDFVAFAQAQAAAAERQPDLLMIDAAAAGDAALGLLDRFRMPASGAEETPVIVLTAPDDDAGVVEALERGAVDVVRRPFAQLVMQSRVRAALRGGARALETRAIEKVLIVDDDSNLHTLLDYHLEDLVKRRFHATTGASGIKFAEAERPDLILLDVQMPGMDGFEVLRALRGNETTRGIPVLFLTADAKPFRTARGLDMGAVDYIPKPVTGAELRARIRSAVRGA